MQLSLTDMGKLSRLFKFRNGTEFCQHVADGLFEEVRISYSDKRADTVFTPTATAAEALDGLLGDPS